MYCVILYILQVLTENVCDIAICMSKLRESLVSSRWNSAAFPFVQQCDVRQGVSAKEKILPTSNMMQTTAAVHEYHTKYYTTSPTASEDQLSTFGN
jgi:hypothetical protein